jgi:hypothetical protein
MISSVPPSFANRFDYYRERAKTVRAAAEATHDRESKETLLRLARAYDEMVAHLERSEKSEGA